MILERLADLNFTDMTLPSASVQPSAAEDQRSMRRGPSGVAATAPFIVFLLAPTVIAWITAKNAEEVEAGTPAACSRHEDAPER